MASSQGTCASSGSRTLPYSSTRNSRSPSATGRRATASALAARREDTLEGDVEVGGQIGLHVVVRDGGAGREQCLRRHGDRRRPGDVVQVPAGGAIQRGVVGGSCQTT